MGKSTFTVELPTFHKITEDEFQLIIQETLREYSCRYVIEKNKLLLKEIYKNIKTEILEQMYKMIDYELRVRKRRKNGTPDNI